MSLLCEPKVEPEDVREPDRQELRFSSMVATSFHFELSASPANVTIKVKDDIEEDVWEAVEDKPPVAETPAGSEQKCFSQVCIANSGDNGG